MCFLRILIPLLCLFMISFNVAAMDNQNDAIWHVEPPHWWVSMQHSTLQLMIHGDQVGQASVVARGAGVQLQAVHKAESPNYLFLDLDLAQAQAGKCTFQLSFPDGRSETIEYSLEARIQPVGVFQGFNPDDVIYLITPDRFANGNPDNDRIPGMQDQSLDRKAPYARHGGDIEGIISKLPYIQDMGFTALWSSPLLENNMRESSYHGYAITDFYKVDPRFGTLAEYKSLADACQSRGIKLIMDMVVNHCGLYHWWMQDLPFHDWINHNDALAITNHRRTTNIDPYAAPSDRKLMTEGWFVEQMPDLNASNPFMATYLIQNSIWWIEYLQLGGVRQDTYPYSPKEFMSRWAKYIMEEYPDFNIVGEEWSYNPLLISYWQDSENNPDGYRSHLKSLMDFPLHRQIIEGLKNEDSWDKGIIQIYEALANDFIYPNPSNLMLFGDNHDMDRLYTQLNQDADLSKIAMGLILTLPRIPQVYYGTEILMDNSQQPGHHGYIREDMPGGWPSDAANAFTGQGLQAEQADFQQWMRKLLQTRKQEQALRRGQLMHFVPEDGVYVYFRYTDDEVLMFVINKEHLVKVLDLSRFEQIVGHPETIKDFSSGQQIPISSGLQLRPKSFNYYKIR